jgi:hypothetical protein
VRASQGEITVGVGYATPLLRSFEESGEINSPAIVLMPAPQGAMYWPVMRDNRAALCDMHLLPLHDNTVHHLVMMHVLEHTENPLAMLVECWRVLVPGGRMYMLVPRAARVWRSIGETPFRAGKSYSPRTLHSLLRAAEFTIVESRGLLGAPPSQHPLLLRAWRSMEWLMSLLAPALGSAMLVEVEKQIYAAIRQPARVAGTKKVATAHAAAASSSKEIAS